MRLCSRQGSRRALRSCRRCFRRTARGSHRLRRREFFGDRRSGRGLAEAVVRALGGTSWARVPCRPRLAYASPIRRALWQGKDGSSATSRSGQATVLCGPVPKERLRPAPFGTEIERFQRNKTPRPQIPELGSSRRSEDSQRRILRTVRALDRLESSLKRRRSPAGRAIRLERRRFRGS